MRVVIFTKKVTERKDFEERKKKERNQSLKNIFVLKGIVLTLFFFS